MSYKGRFIPKNPEKYIGDERDLRYKSLWERTLMKRFDRLSSVQSWGYEVLSVPYISPIDGRYHRYIPDFWIKTRNKKGITKCSLIEVKPKHQTEKPKEPKRKSRRYLSECMTYEVNLSKWEAAKKFCELRGWKFLILTEEEIYKTKKLNRPPGKLPKQYAKSYRKYRKRKKKK